MEIITKKRIIKELNITKRILGFTPFVLASAFAVVTECIFTDFSESGSIIALALVFFGLFIPLGVIVGLRQIVKAIQDYQKVKKGMLQTKVLAVVDTGRSRTSSTSNYDCYLDFEEDFSIFISRTEARKRKIGDRFYVVYFSDAPKKRKPNHSIFPIAAYRVGEYMLDDEMKKTEVI